MLPPGIDCDRQWQHAAAQNIILGFIKAYRGFPTCQQPTITSSLLLMRSIFSVSSEMEYDSVNTLTHSVKQNERLLGVRNYQQQQNAST